MLDARSPEGLTKSLSVTRAGPSSGLTVDDPAGVIASLPDGGRAPLSIGSPSGDAGAGAARPAVLVAEDNRVNQMVAVRLLESRGYRAEVVADGRAAVDALFAGDYSAVLMDCQMPVMDGYEATAEIRRREDPAARVPIVATTAHAMTGDRDRCLAAGMDDYLSKPIRPKEMEAILERYCSAQNPGS